MSQLRTGSTATEQQAEQKAAWQVVGRGSEGHSGPSVWHATEAGPAALLQLVCQAPAFHSINDFCKSPPKTPAGLKRTCWKSALDLKRARPRASTFLEHLLPCSDSFVGNNPHVVLLFFGFNAWCFWGTALFPQHIPSLLTHYFTTFVHLLIPGILIFSSLPP